VRRIAAALLVLAVVVAVTASAGRAPPAGAAAAGPASPLPASRHVLLGHSTEGRPIRAIRVGDPASSRKALVVGVIHGNETQGLRITRALRRSAGVSGVDLWVVDTVNPDGQARGTRQNARGVDLNRNFSYRWRGGGDHGSRPFSERETRVVRQWIERLRPAVTIWYHQPWNAVLEPCHGSHPVQRAYARRARMATSCRGTGLPGTARSWQRHRFPGTAPFVVELPGRSLGSRAIRRHARAAVAAAEGR
jgi:protein MpaA